MRRTQLLVVVLVVAAGAAIPVASASTIASHDRPADSVGVSQYSILTTGAVTECPDSGTLVAVEEYPEKRWLDTNGDGWICHYTGDDGGEAWYDNSGTVANENGNRGVPIGECPEGTELIPVENHPNLAWLDLNEDGWICYFTDGEGGQAWFDNFVHDRTDEQDDGSDNEDGSRDEAGDGGDDGADDEDGSGDEAGDANDGGHGNESDSEADRPVGECPDGAVLVSVENHPNLAWLDLNDDGWICYFTDGEGGQAWFDNFVHDRTDDEQDDGPDDEDESGDEAGDGTDAGNGNANGSDDDAGGRNDDGDDDAGDGSDDSDGDGDGDKGDDTSGGLVGECPDGAVLVSVEDHPNKAWLDLNGDGWICYYTDGTGQAWFDNYVHEPTDEGTDDESDDDDDDEAENGSGDNAGDGNDSKGDGDEDGDDSDDSDGNDDGDDDDAGDGSDDGNADDAGDGIGGLVGECPDGAVLVSVEDHPNKAWLDLNGDGWICYYTDGTGEAWFDNYVTDQRDPGPNGDGQDQDDQDEDEQATGDQDASSGDTDNSETNTTANNEQNSAERDGESDDHAVATEPVSECPDDAERVPVSDHPNKRWIDQNGDGYICHLVTEAGGEAWFDNEPRRLTDDDQNGEGDDHDTRNETNTGTSHDPVDDGDAGNQDDGTDRGESKSDSESAEPATGDVSGDDDGDVAGEEDHRSGPTIAQGESPVSDWISLDAPRFIRPIPMPI